MTILTVIQQAAALCNMPVPTAVISSSDADTVQMLALAQAEGDETAAAFDWRTIKVLWSMTGDGTTTLFSLPADFDHIAPGTPFYSSAYPLMPLIGPVLDAQLVGMKAFPVQPVRPVWRLWGGSIEIWPALASTDTITGEYRSKNWILGADGVSRQYQFLTDADTSLIPERILKLGVVWRWKQAKGLEYAEDYRTWDNERARVAGHDSGNKTIDMSGRSVMPATYWPVVTPTG